jgi:hypothetical protein
VNAENVFAFKSPLERGGFSPPSASPPGPWDLRTAEELFAPAPNAAFGTDVCGRLHDEGRLPFAQTMGWLLCFAIIGWGIVAAAGLLVWRFIH